MANLLRPVRVEKRISDRIKSEWLGAEARVGIPLRQLDGNRFTLWDRRPPTGSLLLLFVSGLAIGGCFALFIRRRQKGRGRLVYLHANKNMKQEKPLIPGEKIEADVLSGDRIDAIRAIT